MSDASSSLIHDVSDTAIWVAHYRAEESDRSDALFHDPLAKRLAGEKGRIIAEQISQSRYIGWSVVIRTYIIDNFIQDLIANGVDTIVNIGAGLDSRPYRLQLPSSLKWIEIDYPHIMDFKNRTLENDKPNCELTRIGLDLANQKLRSEIFSDIAAQNKNILVLTEGVVPYLTMEQVSSLATDLLNELKCSYWILDYFSSKIARYMIRGKIRRQMQNAPFQFFPEDWHGFFRERGWQQKDIRYMAQESLRLGRAIPLPWWVKILASVTPRKRLEPYYRYSGYVVMEPVPYH